MEEVLLMDAIVKPEVIPHNVSYAILASIILIVTALIVRGSLQLVPRGIQNIMETIVEAIYKLVDENIGHHWGKTLFPFICTIFVFILLCNFMGLIPGFASPTSNVNTNAAMAVPVFLATHYFGIKVHGVKYLNHFLGPIRSLAALPLMILMFFVEVIGHIARPITLTVRLFGNMTGKHIILLVWVLFPVDSSNCNPGPRVTRERCQAFVFALLATLYLAGAVEEAH
jgi:F-type H+-transporting ATPase subunit a